MLRIWRCDCALCGIGNEFPCRQPHNPAATLFRGLSTLHQGKKPLAVSRRKTHDDKIFLGRRLYQIKRFCMVGTRYFESTEKVGRGAILPFLQIVYGHSQLSIIGGECFFVAGGVRAFGGEALVQVADFVVVLLKKKGGLFV